jgi:hypothetical protein
MLNKALSKVFLSEHRKEINTITSDLSDYWTRTNDLSLGCLRYFQDLNNKFELVYIPKLIGSSSILVVRYFIDFC